MEVLGGRLPGSLSGHGSLRTDQRATCIYRTLASQQLKASMLASTHILVFKLATARVFCHPPTTPNCLMAPTLSAGIYRCQRSQATRAATRPHHLRQWNQRRGSIDRLDRLDSFGFLISLYSSGFHYLIRYLLNVFFWLCKIGSKHLLCG